MDVGKLREAEAALRESEQRLAVTLHSIGDAVIATDTASHVVMLNRVAEELTGWSQSEAFSRALAEVFPIVNEKTGETAEDPVRRALETGSVVGLANHTVLIARDGTRRAIADSAAPIRGRNGEVLGVVLVFRDVTEARVAEERLRASEERLRRAQEIAHLGSWELDLTLNRLSWSDEVYRIFGLQPQEFDATYEAFLAAVHPDDRAAVDAAYSSSLREGRDSYEIEHRVVNRSTREIRFVHEKCEHVRDGTGRIVRSIGMVHDITERRMAEESLREADRRKNEFLAVLSHELRNPLAPIRNSLFILERAAPGGDQARRAQAVINRQTGQLARLVDDLLDVTRITRNKIQLQRQRLDLNEVVQRTIEDQRSLFEASEVHLNLNPAPGRVLVNGDWNRLAQVVGNLLQNACKFTSRGGRVSASVLAEPASGQAVIRIADTGVGIAPEMLARLFQPFMQADATLDRSKGGLGLGLALVKGLIELHGGTVSAYSDGLGKGAEFVVRMPLDRAEATEAKRPATDRQPSRRRVLIIEDNVDAADSLRDVLEFGEHEVEVAYSGPEGIAKARTFRPEIVLCDIGLPGMDGYEVARAFRAEAALRGASLVALSGYALPEDLQRASEAGFGRHLAKPPSLEKLEEILAEVP
jgi:PAS domain S-box-containing protein